MVAIVCTHGHNDHINAAVPLRNAVDAPILLPDGEGELTYCPKNFYSRYYGITTVRRALEYSYNASAVKMQTWL